MIIPDIKDTEEQHALSIFLNILDEMDSDKEVVNPLQPIAAGVLDTSGLDIIWARMTARAKAAVAYFCHPPQEYHNLNVHDTIPIMCRELINACRAKVVCGKATLIRLVNLPGDFESFTDAVQLQVRAAHILLEKL